MVTHYHLSVLCSYENVISACSLKQDLEIFPHGDETQVSISPFTAWTVTKALIWGAGLHINIFAFCPTNFFLNQL